MSRSSIEPGAGTPLLCDRTLGIADYAAVGNGRTIAVLGTDTSVDWVGVRAHSGDVRADRRTLWIQGRDRGDAVVTAPGSWQAIDDATWQSTWLLRTLLLPAFGFLPADDARVLSTVDAITPELGAGDLLYRCRCDDDLRGREDAFLACSFWRVEVLAMAGRRDEARELMHRLVARTNDVGLRAEQVDPSTGAFLGNLPQALSHLSLVRAALALEHAGARRPSARRSRK